MTAQSYELTVHFTVLEDGTTLAASVSETECLGVEIPCFVVAGKDRDEVKTRVQDILAFHAKRASDGNRATKTGDIATRLTRTVRPFVSSHTERFRAEALVA